MRVRNSFIALGALAAIPAAFAANPLSSINTQSISQTMVKVWEIIGAVFNIGPAQAPIVIKVLIFLLLFAVFFWSAMNFVFRGDRKTSGIVAGVIAAIVALVTPNAGLIYTLISVFVPLGAVIGLGYLAFYPRFVKGSFGAHWLGVLFLTIALMVNGFVLANITQWVKLADNISPFQITYFGFVQPIFDFVSIALVFAIIVKIIMAFMELWGGAAAVAGAVGGLFDPEARHTRNLRSRERDAERAENESRVMNRLGNPALQPPTTVRRIQFREDPTNPSQVLVEWEPNHADEHVLRYEISYSTSPPPAAAAAAGQNPAGITYNLVGNTTAPNIIMNSGVPPKGTNIHFAVRAENAQGIGPYGFSSYGQTTGSPSPVPPVDPLETQLNDLIGAIGAVESSFLANALRSLGNLRVYDPATGNLLAPRFPVVRPPHPQWPEALNAIHQFRDATRNLHSIAQRLRTLSTNPGLRGSTHLITLHMRAMRLLRVARNTTSKVAAGIILATGVRP